MKNSLLILFIFLTPMFVAAQGSGSEEQPELNSDRPDRSQSPTVVPKGTLQLETGFQFQKDRSSTLDQEEYLYPNVLLRLGLFSNAELRINFDYKKSWERIMPGTAGQETDVTTGLNEVRLETKISLYEGQGLVPSIGFLGRITLPVGEKEFRPPHIAPGGTLLFSHKLSEKVELQYNIGYEKQKEQDEYRGQAIYALNSTVELSDKIKGFVEVFGQKPRHDQAEHQADTGLLILLMPNLQVDVIGGLGLNKSAPSYFVGGGLTWRLPR